MDTRKLMAYKWTVDRLIANDVATNFVEEKFERMEIIEASDVRLSAIKF